MELLLNRIDDSILARIAEQMAWALDYRMLEEKYFPKDGYYEHDIMDQWGWAWDKRARGKMLYKELKEGGTYCHDALERHLARCKDVQENVTGIDIIECYREWCGIFYNGWEREFVEWAVEFGFDLEEPERGSGNWEDRHAWEESAREYASELMNTLDWGSIPQDWIVCHLNKNVADQQAYEKSERKRNR